MSSCAFSYIISVVLGIMGFFTANEKIECVSSEDDEGDRGLKNQGL
jgi:hypothetical protein